MTRNLMYLAAMLLTPAALMASVAAPVPEPATVVLVGAGLAGAILWSRSRKGNK